MTYQRLDYVSRKPFIHGLQNILHRLSLNSVSGSLFERGRETKAETQDDQAMRETAPQAREEHGLLASEDIPLCSLPQGSVEVTRTQAVNNQAAVGQDSGRFCVNSPHVLLHLCHQNDH